MEGVSHSFTKNFHFIDSVKAYLSYALLRASVSQSPVIFQVLLNWVTPLCMLRDLCVNFVILVFFLGSMQLEYSWCCYCDSGRVSKYACHFKDLIEASQHRNTDNLMCLICFYATLFVFRVK